MSRVRDLADFNSRVMDMDGNATDTITADTITADTVTFTSSGTPTITSPTSIIINADSGNGIINFSGSKVMNLGDPVNSQDAASKSYVDTEVSGVESYVNSIIYTDLDVDAHLNTASATSNQVLSWNGTSLTWTTQSSGALGLGNFILVDSVIDTDDSSGITITPAVTISSDLNVENDLRVTNSVYVDSDIKMLDTGTILTINPGGSAVNPYTGETMTWPEENIFEKKVEYHGWSAFLFSMFMAPIPIYSNTNRLLSADITIHIATYNVNFSSVSGYDSDFADSQIIQGHLMHNHTTATFTETSNVCTDPGVNLITLSTSISSSAVSLDFQMAQEKLTRYTVHSRSAMQYNV